MIEKYLKFYISKMNKNDIKNYCIKNNITIDDDELEIIYTYIKENWYEMCFNDTSVTLNKIKKVLKPESYKIAEKLIIEYKEKYKSYL